MLIELTDAQVKLARDAVAEVSFRTDEEWHDFQFAIETPAPIGEALKVTQNWLDEGLGMRRIRLFGKDYKGYTIYLDGESGKAMMGPAADRPYTTVIRGDTLAAALIALAKEIV